jgi:methionine--tRNA ligase beta chain
MINYDEFSKIELRAGKVLSAERVEGSEKLLKLKIDLGDPSTDSGLVKCQIIGGIGKVYKPEDLVGKEIIIVANLEPRKLMGLESQGMLLAAHDADGAPVLLMPDKVVPPGSVIS